MNLLERVRAIALDLNELPTESIDEFYRRVNTFLSTTFEGEENALYPMGINLRTIKRIVYDILKDNGYDVSLCKELEPEEPVDYCYYFYNGNDVRWAMDLSNTMESKKDELYKRVWIQVGNIKEVYDGSL